MYEVSDTGLIRRAETARLLKPANPMQHKGYLTIVLRGGVSSPRARYRIHRLVAEAFLAGYSPLLEVDHINRVRSDNRVANLRMVSRRQNMKNIGVNLQLVETIIGYHSSGVSARNILALIKPTQ